MIIPIEYDMERCFNTTNRDHMTMHIEMGFHVYPDPLATDVVSGVIHKVAYPMGCLLHIHVKGTIFQDICKQYKGK